MTVMQESEARNRSTIVGEATGAEGRDGGAEGRDREAEGRD